MLLNAALQNMPCGFCVWDDAFRLVLWNRHFLDLYGLQPSQLRKGMDLLGLAELAISSGNFTGLDAPSLAERFKADIRGGSDGAQSRSRTVHGSRTIERTRAYSPGLGWIITHEDVTEEIALTEAMLARRHELELQNMRLDAAVNNISQGLCMFDAEGRLVVCNEPYARIYGLPGPMLLPGTRIEAILDYLFSCGMHSPGGRDGYLQWRHEVIARRQYDKAIHELNGRIIMMQHHPMKDGGWVSTHEDITEQRQTEARIRHMARHDALTDLPNRIHFLDEVAETRSRWTRGEKAAVFCIDLDRFKSVNDTLGHAFGDEVLRQVSARLWGTTRETDILARLGGDEFSLLMRPVTDPRQATVVAERIVKAMSTPFYIHGHQIQLGASVGIAMAPDDGVTADELMRNADLALYKSKNEGRSTFHFFEGGMDQALQQRRAIEAGLRTALANDEMRLVFQPLLGLKENRVTCVEALLRWEHPELGTIPPMDFIPIAEETGMIVPIGEWVLREACAIASTWPGDVRVAVNLSAAQFKQRNLASIVQKALADAGLDPARLELEITESLLLSVTEATLASLHILRELGIRISMDDFGTGYSSLSYLRSFPFDKIKIDRSFMRDLTKRSDSLAIIKAVVVLGQSLGMSVAIEGVETDEQLETVRTVQCDEVQGYLCSPPVSPGEMATLLARHMRLKPPMKLRAVS